jgi:hypothetical protein
LLFIYSISASVLDKDQQSLHPSFVEYIDGARVYLELDTEKDAPAMKDIKTHFCGFVSSLISSFSRELNKVNSDGFSPSVSNGADVFFVSFREKPVDDDFMFDVLSISWASRHSFAGGMNARGSFPTCWRFSPD